MSDLERIGDNQMDLRDLAQHQPKRVDDNQRQFRGMLLDEWYEIVQWLQLRIDDASKWSMTKIDVMYSDLKDYTKGDVFYAIQRVDQKHLMVVEFWRNLTLWIFLRLEIQ